MEANSVDNLPVVSSGELGALSAFGTSHIIGTLSSEGVGTGIGLSCYSGQSRCSLMFFLAEEYQSSRFNLTSVYTPEGFIGSASEIELAAHRNLLEACLAKGTDAADYYYGGDYLVLDDRTIISMEGAFTCASVAGRNSSSARFKLGKSKVRISVIGEQAVVFEE